MNQFILVVSIFLISASALAGPIHDAVVAGRATEVERLLRTHPNSINLVDSEGQTALHVAVVHGKKRIAEILMAQGADVDREMTTTSRTPLHIAAEMGRTAIAEVLLDSGAQLDYLDHEGRIALHWAASFGHLDIARLLMDRGSDLNSRDFEGETPLHAAVINGKTRMVEFLVEKGADLTARYRGRTPLDFAGEQHRAAIVQILEAAEHCQDVDGSEDLEDAAYAERERAIPVARAQRSRVIEVEAYPVDDERSPVQPRPRENEFFALRLPEMIRQNAPALPTSEQVVQAARAVGSVFVVGRQMGIW